MVVRLCKKFRVKCNYNNGEASVKDDFGSASAIDVVADVKTERVQKLTRTGLYYYYYYSCCLLLFNLFFCFLVLSPTRLWS